MVDWEDMRAFLAAARCGSFGSAADRLGVDPATISRRTARLESALKATLLSRSPRGLQLTATGLQVFEEASPAAAAMEAAEQAATPDPSGGVVRISVAEGFGTAIVAPKLAEFRRVHSNLRVEVVANPGFLSPTKFEADLAVTLSASASERLHVEPLSEYELGLYASRGYIEDRGPLQSVQDLEQHEIIGYIEDLIYTPELRYLDEVRPGLKPTLSSSSIRAQQAIVAAGGGIGVLPCFLATGLARLLPGEIRLKRRFWISTRAEVRNVRRIKTVRLWLRDLAQQALSERCL